jgi:hypothetical protein
MLDNRQSLAAVARQERGRLSERTIAGLTACRGPGDELEGALGQNIPPHIGQSRSSATERWRLQEGGVLEETRTIAIKEVVAWQTEQAMLKGNITKVEWPSGCVTAARPMGKREGDSRYAAMGELRKMIVK